jgi:hypothetical protein
MQPIKVINGDRDGWVGATRIYIGRLNHSRGLLKSSPLANPYRIGKDGSRKAVVEKYRLWLNAEIEKGMKGEYSTALEQLKRIRDKLLAGEKIELSCYCTPALCHGDVIKEQVEKMAALQLKTRAERPTEELSADLLSIIHCFSSRLYGLRKYTHQSKENC